MKKLLAALAIAATFVGRSYAASTDTAGIDILTFLQNIASATAQAEPADVPAEQKVVEIHMSAPDPVVEEVIKKSKKILPMPLKAGLCSGSFIDDHGDILTAKHCVTNFSSFEVQTYDRRTYAAVVVATSPMHDLALLHIAAYDTPYLRFADKVRRGEDIFALGSPLGITDIVTQGIIAKLAGDDIILDCGVLPGNSGGPVIDRDMKLVGVVVAGYIVGLGTTHLNIALSLDVVRNFLDDVAKNRK